MTQSTIDEGCLLAQFREALQDNAPLHVQWRRRITRADGSIDELIVPKNIVTKDGLNALAARAIGVATSAIAYLAIGTVTAAHSLGSVVTGFGEISRKTPSILASSAEVVIVAMTWAGATDNIANVPLGSAACVNHASSGLGIAYNLTNSVNATLQNSDFLLLQCEIQIGSHNL
jgi:hypothetical protein